MKEKKFEFEVDDYGNPCKASQIFHFMYDKCQSGPVDEAVKRFNKLEKTREVANPFMVKATCASCEGRGYTWREKFGGYERFKHKCPFCKGLGYLMLEAYKEK